MLHKDSSVILPSTFDLLKRLQADEELKDFFLVGGTALALQIGHKYSVDLDLFTKDPIDRKLKTDYIQPYKYLTNGFDNYSRPLTLIP